jgi:hypothetical protein
VQGELTNGGTNQDVECRHQQNACFFTRSFLAFLESSSHAQSWCAAKNEAELVCELKPKGANHAMRTLWQ